MLGNVIEIACSPSILCTPRRAPRVFTAVAPSLRTRPDAGLESIVASCSERGMAVAQLFSTPTSSTRADLTTVCLLRGLKALVPADRHITTHSIEDCDSFVWHLAKQNLRLSTRTNIREIELLKGFTPCIDDRNKTGNQRNWGKYMSRLSNGAASREINVLQGLQVSFVNLVYLNRNFGNNGSRGFIRLCFDEDPVCVR